MWSKYGNIIAATLLLACSFAAGWGANGSRWEAKHSQYVRQVETEKRIQSDDALQKQQQLIEALDNATAQTAQIKAQHDRNIADSRATTDRLRVELDRIKALPAVNHSSTVRERANAATDRRVLAELLTESDRRATVYAGHADELRIKLMQCNTEYNAVRSVANAKAQ